MIQHICDRCGAVSPATKGLYRIMVVYPGSLDLADDNQGVATSRLDLCEDCKNAIMRMANTPTPREAGS